MDDEFDYGKYDVSFDGAFLVLRQRIEDRDSQVSLSPNAIIAFRRILEMQPDERPTAGTQASQDHAVLAISGSEARLLEEPGADGSRTILLPIDQMRELFTR
jgi:hypothetical protein